MATFLWRVVHAPAFNHTVLGLILLASVLVGLETYPGVMERYGTLILGLDRVIIGLFALEAAMKIGAHGRRWHRYFRDPWNVFDFTIVVLLLLPIGGPYAAVGRLVRVLRALRLLSVLPRLQMLVGALLKSVPSMGYVSMLLALMFYIYAVLGVFWFGKNDPVHFGTLQASLLSLFRTVTLDDWVHLMYTQMWGSETYGLLYQGREELIVESRGMPFLGAMYFVTFILAGTMIILNLFIGVIMQGMHEMQDETEHERLAKRRATGGGPSLSEEVAQLERDLGAMVERLHTLRLRAEDETPARAGAAANGDGDGDSDGAGRG